MPRKDTTKIKHALIASFGGACQRCGYNQCVRALHFHHKDASEKAEWSQGRGNASQDEISQYPERFMLVCANCHAEIHDEEVQQRKRTRLIPCLNCGKQFSAEACRTKTNRDQYCSRKCQHAHRICLASDPERQKKRLFKKVAFEGACWRWIGYKQTGVGMTFYTTPEGQRIGCTARKLAYLLFCGAIPEGMEVWGSCEHLDCIAPTHLILRPRNADSFSRPILT